MNKLKLQIFLSSTYEDLIDHRLAAIEAILAAGHIPAAMEQFSAADETAWEKIQTWIDESDAFILLLGGRYGLIEPKSGKSYIQLEYEYAQAKQKPSFSLVVDKEHQEQRVKAFGLKVHESEHPDKYKQFYTMVTQRLCRFWSEKKDIQAAILQKLPEWMQKPDVVGWMRADGMPSIEVMNELARLSQENRDLRSRLETQEDRFDGLTFEEMVKGLRSDHIPLDLQVKMFNVEHLHKFLTRNSSNLLTRITRRNSFGRLQHAGDIFEIFQEVLSNSSISLLHIPDGLASSLMQILASHGLVHTDQQIEKMRIGSTLAYSLTDMGRRFRNRMLSVGDDEDRMKTLWGDDAQEQANNSS